MDGFGGVGEFLHAKYVSLLAADPDDFELLLGYWVTLTLNCWHLFVPSRGIVSDGDPARHVCSSCIVSVCQRIHRCLKLVIFISHAVGKFFLGYILCIWFPD